MSDSESPAGQSNGEYASELLGSIDEVLSVLQSVSAGDLTPRLTLGFPETHPVGALAESVNSMVDALQEVSNTAQERLAELSKRIEVIERQREAIRTLAVPVIEIWERVLCVPIVGALDALLATEVTAKLLSMVVSKKAKNVIIDVTGIQSIDTSSADHFLRMARAVRLLGSNCSLSGLRPAIAQTIVQLGVDLGEVRSYRNMRDALKDHVRRVRGAAGEGK